MTNLLALIAGRSPTAARMAADAILSAQNKSPMAAARAARAARFALEDPLATFSADERRAIAELLENDRDAAPIRFRVTADERARLERMAEDAQLSISDFIRQKIGL
jgi:hypothetical protein